MKGPMKDLVMGSYPGFKTLGGWDVEVVLLLKKITIITARKLGKLNSEVHRFLVAKVSLAIQCFNAV